MSATTDIYEVMNTQRAVRRWTDEPVSEATIRRVIEAATKAPSGSNLQPWAFVVVTDDAKRQLLADAIRASFKQRFGGQRPDPEQIEDPVQRRMMRGAFRLFDNFAAAPVLIIHVYSKSSLRPRKGCLRAVRSIPASRT